MEDRRFPRASTTTNTRKRTNERTSVNTRFVVISSFRLARTCLVSDHWPSFVKDSDNKLAQSNGADHSLLRRHLRNFRRKFVSRISGFVDTEERLISPRFKSIEETSLIIYETDVATHLCWYHDYFAELLLIMMF